MIEIRGIKVPILNSIEKLEKQITKKLRIKQVPQYVILKRSIDARKKSEICYVYQVGVFLDKEENIVRKINNNNITLTKRVQYTFSKPGEKTLSHHPMIIGSGPAGLFCALILAQQGYQPISAQHTALRRMEVLQLL